MIFFKTIRRLLPGLLIVGLLVGFGCSSPSDSDDDGGGGGNGGDDPVTYELSVQANPSEAGSVDPESGTYEEGEEVEVEATGDDGWEFTGWSGDMTSDENPLTFTIDEDTDLTAEFVEEETGSTTYELAVNTEPSEGGSVDPESGTFEDGEEVEISATAADGWEFNGWSGDITSDENPLTFTIEEDTDLTAKFSEAEPQTYDLTVNADPADGGTVSPESGTYDEGEEVEVTATANDGWEFAGWSGDIDSDKNPVTVRMDSNTTITADFSKVEYKLSVNTDPSEGGSVDPESGTYEEGEEVEVTATAADGWEFVGWTGDVNSSQNPLTVTMDNNTAITAEFEPVTYELTVNVDQSEGGTVNPTGGTYDAGTEIEINANANSGWSFAGWSGDINSTNNPLTFTINQDTELLASFEEDAQAYSNQIQLSDGDYSETLTFGMHENATAGFDSDLENEAPPAPPSGSYYAHLNIEGYNLYDDFRPIQDDQTIWEIEFSPSSSNTMTLTWDFSSSDHAGDLTLVDDPNNATIEINMESQNSYEVTDTSVNTLYIIQQ